MNPANIISSGVHNSIANTITINTSQLNAGMMSDGMSEPSSPDSSFDASDLIDGAMGDDVTAQLASAGPIGIAAAAAIASGRKKKRPHLFETNPSVRKRQQTRLLRKLKSCIEEYTTRVGQQAVVLCCTPCKSTSSSSLNSYKVFGSQPLETVIKNCKNVILHDLDAALAEQTPPNHDNSGVYDLPTLALDGIPTPVDKMTQAQLRTFIPEMLKYSTGRSKPGWGKTECRPLWWPNDLPWANVRSDVRTDEEKKRVSWTDALKTIVKNCYRHHGREDLLNIFGEYGSGEIESAEPASGQYTGTMVQTINNPDGTVSIIQIDTGPNSVVTLPDGTQATVVHSMTAIPQENISQDGQHVETMGEVAVSSQPESQQVTPVSLEMANGAHSLATINGGRLMLASGDTAQITTDPTTAIMTIPVSMYQSLVASSNQQNGIEIQNSGQISIAQIQQQQQQQQQQLLSQQYEQQQQSVEMQTQEIQHEIQQNLVQQQQQQQQELQIQVQQQQLQVAGDDGHTGNITVRVVSVEPKHEPS